MVGQWHFGWWISVQDFLKRTFVRKSKASTLVLPIHIFRIWPFWLQTVVVDGFKFILGGVSRLLCAPIWNGYSSLLESEQTHSSLTGHWSTLAGLHWMRLWRILTCCLERLSKKIVLLYSVTHSWHMTYQNSLCFKKSMCRILLVFYIPLKPFKFRKVSVSCVSVLCHYSVSSLLPSCTGNASLSLLGATATYSELSLKRPVCLCF